MMIAEVIEDLRRHDRFALMTDEEIEGWMRGVARHGYLVQARLVDMEVPES